MRSENSLRAVYILAVSNAVFTLGYGMYGYIFPKFLRSVNATPPEIGVVSTVLPVSMALTLLPGGILSDKGYRRKLVIASWLLPAFAPPFFMGAELANSWLYALPGVVIFGSSWIGVAAVQSYTSEAAPKGKRGLSFGILVSSASVGLIPSPLIGGLVLDAYGFTTLFLLAFILYAVSVVIVLAIPKLEGDSRAKRDAASGGPDASPKRSEMRSIAGAESKRDATMKESEPGHESSVLRRLTPMLALSCLFMGFVYIGWSYVPLYLTDQYGFDYQSVQLMSAVLNLSSMVIVNVLGKLSDRCSSANRISLGVVPVALLVFAYWLLLSTSNIAYLSASFVLMGSTGAIFPILYSVVGELSAGRRVGRTYGVIGTFIYAAEATTPYIGGTLYAASNQLPFILTLTLSPLLFVAVYIARRKTH